MKKQNFNHLEKVLQNLPKSPGVYQMKDSGGGVMYVGKAKNLKSRVSSYFVKTNDLSVAKRQMVEKIADIEILTCKTEVEALVLETNFIKHLTPKYNILMKDDKNLAYIKVTNSPIPELIKTRQKIRDGSIYFGPYVSAVEHSVRALRRIFHIRNCRVKFAQNRQDNTTIITDKAGKTIPCMDYYIGICPAPCLLQESKIATHTHNIDLAKDFLSGEASSVFADLEYEMREKAKNQEFEKAQEIKITIETLRVLHEQQKVRDIVDGDLDICIQYEKYEKTYIALTQVRGGQIVGVFRHEVRTGIDEGEDIMISFLMRQYIDLEDLPDILLTDGIFSDSAFSLFLSEKKIKHEFPKIGSKKDLLDFTLNQLREYAYKKELTTLENKTLTRDHMVNVLERLSYPIPPKGEIVFECYDISHTDGHFTYASRVVTVNGKPDPKRYKQYKIKTLKDGMIDDFASHREVMIRRTIEGITENNFPHLIIIDGGKGQLSSAISGIKEGIYASKKDYIDSSSQTEQSITEGSVVIQVSDNMDNGLLHSPGGLLSLFHSDSPFTSQGQIPPICSIAKREEEIFIPFQKKPIMFDKGSSELMVLQKARDESHRFSITANRSARTKAMKKNILEELPGIGPVTRKKLLKIAGSVDRIREISAYELSKICNIAQIETLRDHGLVK